MVKFYTCGFCKWGFKSQPNVSIDLCTMVWNILVFGRFSFLVYRMYKALFVRTVVSNSWILPEKQGQYKDRVLSLSWADPSKCLRGLSCLKVSE